MYHALNVPSSKSPVLDIKRNDISEFENCACDWQFFNYIRTTIFALSNFLEAYRLQTTIAQRQLINSYFTSRGLTRVEVIVLFCPCLLTFKTFKTFKTYGGALLLVGCVFAYCAFD
jgi:hypothetical protein